MVESMWLNLDIDAYKQTIHEIEQVAHSCLVLVVHYCFLCLKSENSQHACKMERWTHSSYFKYDAGATVRMEPEIYRI